MPVAAMSLCSSLVLRCWIMTARPYPGPHSDRMWEQMTPGEYGYVLQVWDAMPGNTCWMDAFHRIAKGKVE
jgi:hypothetical protein